MLHDAKYLLMTLHDRFSRVAILVTVLGLATFFGCASQKDPPEATISWLAPRTRAAKAADCAMPVLAALPNTEYQEVAVVEISADYDEDGNEMNRLARREACQTGADALVVTEDQRQKLGGVDHADAAPLGKTAGGEAQHTPEVGEAGHKGRFLNAVAIIYSNYSNPNSETAPAALSR